jgi:glycerate 2-kinase
MLFKNKEQLIKNGKTSGLRKIRKDVLDILTSAIESVDPYDIVKSKFTGKKIIFESKIIDSTDFKNIFLIGFGKASVGMAQGVCDSIDIKKGVVITNNPYKKVKNKSIITLVGSHPIPNKKSLKNTNRVLEIVKKCNKNDLLIVLISGGGSALLCKPRVNIKDYQLTTDLLLRSSAKINEINTVRKHLSFIKGGQLTNYFKCKVISFIISDIVGDPLEFIASGPTYEDSTTYYDTYKILKRYRIWNKIPTSVKKVIKDGIYGKIPETIKKNNPIFNNVYNFIVANNEIACKAAEKKANELGYKTTLLTTKLTGEAREIGKFLVKKAIDYRTSKKNFAFISGGETTVKIIGNGRGGRNLEMVLSGVKKLSGKNVVFASFATDGIDGNCDAAGAIADSFTCIHSLEKGLEPNNFLNKNNSYDFFKNLKDLLITNITGTNVMDIQILIKTK